MLRSVKSDGEIPIIEGHHHAMTILPPLTPAEQIATLKLEIESLKAELASAALAIEMFATELGYGADGWTLGGHNASDPPESLELYFSDGTVQELVEEHCRPNTGLSPFPVAPLANEITKAIAAEAEKNLLDTD